MHLVQIANSSRRAVAVVREPDLGSEDLPLDETRRMVVVVVESALADGDHNRVDGVEQGRFAHITPQLRP